MAPIRLSTDAEYQTLINGYDTFMFDCDGVLWHGDHLVPGVRQVLAYLRALSRRLFSCYCTTSFEKALMI